MQIRKQSAFTMIEMLVVMMLISIFLLLTMTSKGLSNLRVIDDEANIISFITELNYIKSQAIANQGYINVRFYENSDTIKVIENNKIRFLKLKVGKIINVAKVDIIAFDKKGNINKFGSITIDNNNSIYRIIFHIEKEEFVMKSYKCKGSFLIDSMAGFLLIGLITLLLIPMMNQMQASINHKLQSIDASKVILTTVSKINKEELKKGVTIGKYDIKQSDQQICAISKNTTSYQKTCIQY